MVAIYAYSATTELVYEQSSGIMYLEDAVGVRTPLFRGYSGAKAHLNDPAYQGIRDVGPIPRGRWQLDAPVDRHSTGPVSIGLKAAKANQTFGRSGFFIHGDNGDGNGTASRGCIILNRKCRDVIAALYWAGWRTLEVVE